MVLVLLTGLEVSGTSKKGKNFDIDIFEKCHSVYFEIFFVYFFFKLFPLKAGIVFSILLIMLVHNFQKKV